MGRLAGLRWSTVVVTIENESPRVLLATVEGDVAAGFVRGLVVGVVGLYVVPVAQGDAVLDAGAAPVDPAGLVVGVQPMGSVTARCSAAAVAGDHRVALVLRVQASAAADFEPL